MSRFTDLFQPKSEPVPAPVVEEKEVVSKSDKVVEIDKLKTRKNK